MDKIPTPIVSTEWLQQHLDDPELVILDCSYHMPTEQRDAFSEYTNEHIPKALFFDFDCRIKDPENPLPHMLPTPQHFAEEVSKLGISNSNFVVIYDSYGLFSAARGWWMFRVFGHDRVAILDGGLPKWKQENRPVSNCPIPRPYQTFSAGFRSELVASSEQLLMNLEDKRTTVVDARSSERFQAEVAEPRPGVRAGRIPCSVNLPFSKLINSSTGSIVQGESLKAVLRAHNLDPDKRLIASCGSGVTSCIIALAYFLLGNPDVAIYDGSWSEWGADSRLPIEN